MNQMIWMTNFNMKFMPPHIKIKKLLRVANKAVLMFMTPVEAQIYHKSLIITSFKLIYMFE